MELNQAIELLSTIVKDSEASDGNKHLNMSLVPAEKRQKFQEALAVAKNAVTNGEMNQDDLLRILKVN